MCVCVCVCEQLRVSGVVVVRTSEMKYVAGSVDHGGHDFWPVLDKQIMKFNKD